MHKRIVVGVDGSNEANDALALAASIAAGTGAAITLAYVYTKQPTAESQSRSYRRHLRDTSVGILKAAQATLPPDIEVDHGAFPADTTAHGLRDLAQEAGAGLIVLGSTHYTPVGQVLIGSVGELLCSDCSCAVAIAPRGLSDGATLGFKRIGVAFDGSDDASVALVEAISLCEVFDAELTVLTVLESGRFRLNSKTRQIEQKAKATLAEILDGIGSRVQVEHRVSRGDAADQLVKAAAELDLLVVGSRGLGPIRHALLGGVSGRLMRAAPCPVVVVPAELPAGKKGKAHSARSQR